jgi:hypothetical protein
VPVIAQRPIPARIAGAIRKKRALERSTLPGTESTNACSASGSRNADHISMPQNYSELFEIARWEYEGGSIASREAQTEESIPVHSPPALPARNPKAEGWVEGFRANETWNAIRGNQLPRAMAFSS